MKNYSFLLLTCLTFTASCVHAMDNNNALIRLNTDAGQDLMRESRALLTTAGRESVYQEFERPPQTEPSDKKLERSSTELLIGNAKNLAKEALKKRREILEIRTERVSGLDLKIQLLTAQKTIERQLSLIAQPENHGNKEHIEQLRTFMSEAYIAIEAANNFLPQQEIHLKKSQQQRHSLTHTDLVAIQAAEEADRMMLENVEAQAYFDSTEEEDDRMMLENVETQASVDSDSLNNNNNNNNNNNTKVSAVTQKTSHSSFAEEEDVDAILARVDSTLAEVKVSRARGRVDLPLSPRAQKLNALLQELPDKMLDHPGASYDICLAQLQKHAELLFSKIRDENNATLHGGMAQITEHGQTVDYLVFTAMLECGTERNLLDRKLIFNGRTILDAAMATGNDMLVQLVTSKHPNKETLTALALEHDKQELLYYLLG